MTPESLGRLLRGPFNFLDPQPDELRRLVADPDRILPPPQRIYLDDEAATPILGYPILLHDGIAGLRKALEDVITAEERVQLALLRREPYDAKACNAAWERYRGLLKRVTGNVAASSYGRHFPAVFWLFHSVAVSRLLKETPRRVLALDLALGRAQGDAVKYKVFHRFYDRVLQLTYDEVHRVAVEAEEAEEVLFPALLRRMGDNVLILTEDYVGRDLAELATYLKGYLGLDPRDFRERLRQVAGWHLERAADDPETAAAARHLCGVDPRREASELLRRPGYLSWLATRPGYDAKRFPGGEAIQVWERLLLRLKEFELILGLRRRIVPVRNEDGRLVCRDPGLGWAPAGPGEVQLSGATRPLDFTAPWVVDPVVHRFGLIYDMTNFSEIVSVLRHRGRESQEDSFRMAFHFQRWVTRLARNQRLKLEKYMGDGALFSGRHPGRLLVTAILLQRHYRRVLAEGFPFDRGMRIALNYGAYRLLPIEDEEPGGPARYEFLGHGIVELSRLVTGKATREIDEIKTLLVSRGYPSRAVDRFFEPIMQQNVDVVEKAEESRPFYAYINRNGNLVNEGIVATEGFVEQLDAEGRRRPLTRRRDGERTYVAFPLEEGGERLLVGIRKLGMASFKGLGLLAVFEVLDGEPWKGAELQELPAGGLQAALEREFADQFGAAAG